MTAKVFSERTQTKFLQIYALASLALAEGDRTLRSSWRISVYVILFSATATLFRNQILTAPSERQKPTSIGTPTKRLLRKDKFGDYIRMPISQSSEHGRPTLRHCCIATSSWAALILSPLDAI